MRKLLGLHYNLTERIYYINTLIEYYYNKKYKNVPLQKKGDKVYLRIKNLKTRRLCKKLDYTKIRSFQIEKKTFKVNFKLALLLSI